jgi:hypothetical protein
MAAYFDYLPGRLPQPAHCAHPFAVPLLEAATFEDLVETRQAATPKAEQNLP